MYLKKIIIKNFMMYESFEQSFTDGLNVVSGITKTGKTCMFKAIQFLFNQCTLSPKDYRREGTKETSVEGILSNGCTVERIKTNSVNKYVLKKKGYEDKPFDSWGKSGNLPEEIADALEISQIDIDGDHICLNFGDQDDINFMIDKKYSDGVKAKLFNKLTGNEILNKLFKELKKEALKANKDIKSSEELIEQQETQLNDYSLSYKTLKNKLSMVTKQYKEIEKDNQECELLNRLSDKLKKIKETEEFISFKLSKIKIVEDTVFDELKVDNEEMKKLSIIFDTLQGINKDIIDNEQKLKSIKTVDIDFNELKKEEQSLHNFRRLAGLIASLTEKEIDIEINIKDTKDRLKKNKEELSKYKIDNPNCPLCGKEY